MVGLSINFYYCNTSALNKYEIKYMYIIPSHVYIYKTLDETKNNKIVLNELKTREGRAGNYFQDFHPPSSQTFIKVEGKNSFGGNTET